MASKPFVPTVWPQDGLNPPTGYTNLPKIDPMNAKNVKREYFVYSGRIDAMPFDTTQTIVIPIGNDADFWYTQLTAQVFVTFTGAFPPVAYTATALQVTVKDINSGFQQFNPSVSIDALRINDTTYGGLGTATATANISADTAVPNYVVRGGGLEVTAVGRPIAGLPGATVLYMQFSFIGWKEYQHVAT